MRLLNIDNAFQISFKILAILVILSGVLTENDAFVTARVLNFHDLKHFCFKFNWPHWPHYSSPLQPQPPLLPMSHPPLQEPPTPPALHAHPVSQPALMGLKQRPPAYPPPQMTYPPPPLQNYHPHPPPPPKQPPCLLPVPPGLSLPPPPPYQPPTRGYPSIPTYGQPLSPPERGSNYQPPITVHMPPTRIPHDPHIPRNILPPLYQPPTTGYPSIPPYGQPLSPPEGGPNYRPPIIVHMPPTRIFHHPHIPRNIPLPPCQPPTTGYPSIPTYGQPLSPPEGGPNYRPPIIVDMPPTSISQDLHIPRNIPPPPPLYQPPTTGYPSIPTYGQPVSPPEWGPNYRPLIIKDMPPTRIPHHPHTPRNIPPSITVHQFSPSPSPI